MAQPTLELGRRFPHRQSGVSYSGTLWRASRSCHYMLYSMLGIITPPYPILLDAASRCDRRGLQRMRFVLQRIRCEYAAPPYWEGSSLNL